MGLCLKFMSTYLPTKKEANNGRKWLLVDAAGKTLGRLSSEIAAILRGKHKTTFTPHVDVGDFVVVINASKVRLTGSKLENKIYFDYSGYIGGLKRATAGHLLEKKPEDLITRAVQKMLPRGPLGFAMLTKLKVYGDGNHPHAAQRPENYTPKYCAQ